MHRLEDALTYINYAIKYNPEDLENVCYKANILHEMKKLDEALECFD